MTLSDDLKAFAEKVRRRQQLVFVETAAEVHRSVVEGSEITAAPGQPVDTGNLRASWQLRFIDDRTAESATHVVYAPNIEEGRGPHGPLTLRSQVGGFHSLALTRAGFQRIVDAVAVRVK